MGKKSTPAPPPAPDPAKVAAAQTASNLETARANANLNRLDETDPMGSVRYTDLGGDRWRKDTSLSPVGQEQFDLQNQVDAGTNRLALQGVNQASKVLSTPFSLDGLTQDPEAGSRHYGDVQRSVGDGGPIQSGFGDAGQIQRGVGANDFSADRQRVEQGILSRMEPGFERDRAGMEQRLADQGIPAGSEAYNRQMDELNRQKTDARQQAILAGGQEQSRMFGMDLNKGAFANQAQGQSYDQEMGRAGFANDAQAQQFGQGVQQGQFANQASAQFLKQESDNKNEHINQRQRQLQELLLQRSQPINEIGALMGTGQVGMPTFQNAAQVQVANTDTMRPVENQYASQMAGWNAKNQRRQGLQNGMFGLAGGLGSAYLMG